MRPVAAISGITLHYTASPTRDGIEAVRAIAAYQTGPGAHEEFPAIAYHLVVCGEGNVYWCNDLDVRVWHSGAVVNGLARNYTHIGIAYIGDQSPNAAQLIGLKRAIRWCEATLHKGVTVEGHRDAPYATACPGPAWPGWAELVMP